MFGSLNHAGIKASSKLMGLEPSEAVRLLNETPGLNDRPYAISLLARAHLANNELETARDFASNAVQMLGPNHIYLASLAEVLSAK
jgi:hypothetical protein